MAPSRNTSCPLIDETGAKAEDGTTSTKPNRYGTADNLIVARVFWCLRCDQEDLKKVVRSIVIGTLSINKKRSVIAHSYSTQLESGCTHLKDCAPKATIANAVIALDFVLCLRCEGYRRVKNKF